MNLSIKYIIILLFIFPLEAQEQKNSEPLTLALSQDEKILIAPSTDTTIGIWSLENYKLLKVLKGHENTIRGTTICDNGKTILSSSHDSTVKLWDIETGKLLKSFIHKRKNQKDKRSKRDKFYIASISPNNDLIVSASKRGQLRLWDRKTGKIFHNVQGDKYRVTAILFTKDNKHIITGGSNSIKLWNISKDKKLLLHKTLKPYESVFSLRLNKDESQLIAGGNRHLSRYDIKNWEGDGALGNQPYINSLILSKDNSLIATSSGHGYVISIRDYKSLKTIKELKGHKYTVIGMVFSKDNKKLYSFSLDDEVTIWDVESGKILKTLNASSNSSVSSKE